MKIKIKVPYSSTDVQIDNLEGYIIDHLDGNDYDRGVLESAHQATTNISSLLAKLIELLAAKDVLTNEDLSKLLRLTIVEKGEE